MLKAFGLIIITVFGFSTALSAENSGVNFFKGSWADLLKEAKTTKKPFFVDFWAAWCGPCRLLNQTTFKDKKVGEYTDQYFIAYKVDVDNGEGRELGAQFNIRSLPTIVYFTAEGKEIARESGYRNPEEFLLDLKKHTPRGSKASKKSSSSFEDFKATKDVMVNQLERKFIGDTAKFFAIKKFYACGCVKDDLQYDELMADFKKQFGQEDVWLAEAYYLYGAKDYNAYIKLINKQFEAKKLTDNQLAFFAWQTLVLEEIPHEPMQWINAALRKSFTIANLEIKAALQLKDKKPTDAKITVQQALKLAGKEPIPPTLQMLQDLTNVGS